MIRNRVRKTGRDRATVAVEFAFAFSALAMLMFAIFEYGRFLMVKHLLDHAVREGAREAVVNTSTTPVPDIQATVFGYLTGQPLLNSSGVALSKTDIQVFRADPATGLPMTDAKGSTWTNAAFGEAIAVKLNAQYRPMLPTFGIIPDPIPVSFICVMRSEGN